MTWGFKLNNVTASWSKDSKNILTGINLDFQFGDTAALPLMGPSGEGKSTLLYLLATLKLPTVGSITWQFPNNSKNYTFGQDSQSLSTKEMVQLRRNYFGFAFQNSTLSKHLTVIENIAYPLLLQGKKWNQALEIAKTTFKEVLLPSEKQDQNLIALMESFPSQLSGGQRQRAALAQAMVHNPCLLFADEPTGQLDIKTRKQVMMVLKQWLEKENGQRALIWVTHHNVKDLDLMDINNLLFIEQKQCFLRDRAWLENWMK